MEDMGIGELMGVWLQIQLIGLAMFIMSVVIFIVVVGHMLEIYLTISIAPIPLSTMVNREWSGVGNNYLKALLAVAFQGFLIMVCVAYWSETSPPLTISMLRYGRSLGTRHFSVLCS